MPQNAILISNSIGPSGGAVPLRANNQGESIVQTTPGNTFYVNATTGNDSNAGNWQHPLATLSAALALCTPNNGDKIFLSGTVHLTATLNWNVNGVSLIGLTSPSDNDRARISSTGATAFSPLVEVSANGCNFINVATFHGGFTGATGSQVCWDEGGGRNYYSHVQFLGGGDSTTAALAGMRSLTITAGGENLFEDCTIGLDTITRATNANASLELLSSTPRNIMRRCVFQALCSDASDVHIKVAADGMDRYLLLDNCTFINCVDSTATTLTAAISCASGAGGSIIVQGGASLGATAIAASGAVYVSGAVPTGSTSSIAVAAT